MLRRNHQAGPWTGFTKHYPNKRPHSGSGINAMALIPDEKRLQFATAGNDVRGQESFLPSGRWLSLSCLVARGLS